MMVKNTISIGKGVAQKVLTHWSTITIKECNMRIVLERLTDFHRKECWTMIAIENPDSINSKL